MAANIRPSTVSPAQYGDKKTLADTARATKTTPISGATVPKRRAGRPPGSTTTRQQAEAPGVPPEHREIIRNAVRGRKELEDKKTVRDFWANIANNPDSGMWAKFYAIAAQKQLEIAAAEYEKHATNLRTQTPNFDF